MREDRDTPPGGQASNVIMMNRHRSEARFPHIGRVEAYWHALRGGRVMPDRAEIDPRGIEFSLEHAFILEQIAPGIGRLRIAGTYLGDILGMEVRGMPLSAFFTPEARSELTSCLEAVCAAPSMARLSLRAESGIGKPVLEACLLLLPLRGEGGEVNRVLGCLDCIGSIGRTPRRFAILHRRLTQISEDGHCQQGMPRRRTSLTAPQAEGFGEAVTPFRQSGRLPDHKTPTEACGHLRLITPDI